jgi:homoserine O-succinyltransferase
MADGGASPRGDLPSFPSRTRIEIGLVNNMPDAALAATERQFAGLIASGSADLDVRLRLFSLPGVERSEAARRDMHDRYVELTSFEGLSVDALIVTGNEPRAADLRAEPYWPHMAALIDWAERNTLSTLWSCLAAHAAVLHLDGVERQPLAQKCSGVFLCEQVADDPLMAGMASMIRMPHSRRNGLAVGDLAAKGYHLLTHSREAGADLFVRRGESLFVFFQGHPEYDADSLLKEYCRDVGRHLRGDADDPPAPPSGYFDATTEAAFRALAHEARRAPSQALTARCSQIAVNFRPPQPWRHHAEVLFANWLHQVALMKAVRSLPALNAVEMQSGLH